MELDDILGSLRQELSDKTYFDLPHLLNRLRETVEAKKPLQLWTKGDHDCDISVDDMEKVGWVKSFSAYNKTFYYATDEGVELYEQLFLQGYYDSTTD